MTVTYQKELFIKLMPELPEIFAEHHNEIEEDHKYPLDPDWQRYIAMEANGSLLVVTARCEGYLLGYYFAIIAPSLHHKQLRVAYSDMFYIRSEFRLGWTGYKLIRETEKLLKKLKVHKSYLVTKPHYPITILVKRLKYVLTECLYAKHL